MNKIEEGYLSLEAVTTLIYQGRIQPGAHEPRGSPFGETWDQMTFKVPASCTGLIQYLIYVPPPWTQSLIPQASAESASSSGAGTVVTLALQGWSKD